MQATSLPRLLDIMAQLRQACPWDKAQTPQSLTRYAIEEAYEVEAAIRHGDTAHIKEELGDLLLQVVFQACMYEEAKLFDFEDIVVTLSEKLVRRHPHVFDPVQAVANVAEVDMLWQKIKQQEQQDKQHQNLQHGQVVAPSLLASVKPAPALNQAQALQKVAAQVGFDWPDVAGAQQKVVEEVSELNEAIASGDTARITDELGDCFFALTNVARKLSLNSEMALLGTVHKFRQRFAFIETQLALLGKTPEQSTLAEMDALWNIAKREVLKT